MENKNRLLIISVGAVAVFLIAVFALYPKFKVNSAPSAIITSFKTETVERGTVMASITTTGIVEPGSEVSVLSPTRSTIKEIVKTSGSPVEKGETIIVLDDKNLRDEIEQSLIQLEIRRNALEKNELNAKNIRIDLAKNEEQMQTRLDNLKASYEEQKKLLEAGGTQAARVDQIKQDVEQAENNLKTLKEKNAIRLQQMEIDKKGIELQIRLQEKSLRDKRELLKQLTVKAPATGILSEVSGTIGEVVNTDQVLAKVADYSSFKLVGTIDKKYAHQIKTGNPVVAGDEGATLNGRIGNIAEMEGYELIRFDVNPEQQSDKGPAVGQNIKLAITSNKENVLRIKKMPGFRPGISLPVFVVKGNKAVKTVLVFGAVGEEWCEIVSGAEEGDKIIVEGHEAFTGLNIVDIQD